MRLKAKGRESVWGKGRRSAGMEAAAQKVAMGPGWRPPPSPGWDSGAGLLGGSRGFSQIVEQKEGRFDLGHQREEGGRNHC